jgi:hypothetical protein
MLKRLSFDARNGWTISSPPLAPGFDLYLMKIFVDRTAQRDLDQLRFYPQNIGSMPATQKKFPVRIEGS